MRTEFTRIVMEDSFGCVYLEFDFVSGIHNVGGLNGAGKTTLYLGLAQGLFNKNPKGVKIEEVSNIITKKPYRITVMLRKGSDSYKVVNSRKNGSITIEMNGKSLTKKTIPQNLELIKEILGDSYETFVSMTYQSTESTLDLVEESSDTARKGFINRIIKTEELDAFLAENKMKLKGLTLKSQEKAKQIISLKSSILPMREVGTLVDTTFLQLAVDSIASAKEDVENRIVELENELSESSKKAYLYADFVARSAKRERLSKQFKQLKKPAREKEEIEAEDGELRGLISACMSKRGAARDTLLKLSEPDLVCSRCGHELNSESALKLYLKDKQEAEYVIAQAGDRIKELEGELWLVTEEMDEYNRYSEVSAELSRATVGTPPAKFEEGDLDKVKIELASSKAALKKLNEGYTEAVRELTEAKGKNELVQMVIRFNAEAKVSNEETEEKVKALEQEIANLEHRIELVNQWIRILGSTGYRVHRMNKFLQVLNHLMVKYSRIISKGKIKCAFSVTEEGKIDFTVTDSDKSIPYTGWSAGEKSRVKLACLFAVLEILEVMGSASYNILFLDEVFATLDESGREGLFEVLAYLKQSGKCIYTVSHTPIANSVVFDSSIQVEKENGITRIV